MVGQALFRGDEARAVDLRLAVGEERGRVVRDGGADQLLHAGRHLLVRRPRVALGKVQHREAGHRRAPAQQLEDLQLVAEVVVHVGLGHAQRLHDLLHGGAGVALRRKEPLGRGQDALALVRAAGRVGALAPAPQRDGKGMCLFICACRLRYTHG